MSKYTNGALQVLEAADTDINQTFTYTEETSECVICSTRRESGWVTVEKSGIISKIGEGVAATLGIAAGYLLRDLIVDKAVFQVKEAQLNRIGKTEVRMKDAAGSIFWARLTSKGENRLLIEDIDIEKNFELDGEDLIEEQEREFNRWYDAFVSIVFNNKKRPQGRFLLSQNGKIFFCPLMDKPSEVIFKILQL